MNKKAITILSIVLFITLLCICFIPATRNVSKSFQCNVLDQQDESYTGAVTVVFTGTYSDYLFRKDTFTGRIEIEGYEFMSANANDVALTVGNNHLSSILEYVPEHNSLKYLGHFCGTEDFDSFFLWIMVSDAEDPSVSHGRYFITFPEMTLDSIYDILQ